MKQNTSFGTDTLNVLSTDEFGPQQKARIATVRYQELMNHGRAIRDEMSQLLIYMPEIGF